MKGTAKDLNLAEDLLRKGRPQDALKMIDRILEIPANASAEQCIEAFRSALAAPASSLPPEAMELIKRGESESVVSGNLLQAKLGSDAAPDIVEFRSRCCVEWLEAAKSQEACKVGLSHAFAVAEVFPDNPTLLALATHPFLITMQYDNVIWLLARAYRLDPKNQLSNTFRESYAQRFQERAARAQSDDQRKQFQGLAATLMAIPQAAAQMDAKQSG